MQLTFNNLHLRIDEKTLEIHLNIDGMEWSTITRKPSFLTNQNTQIYFDEDTHIEHFLVEDDTFSSFVTRFSDFHFETHIMIEKSTMDVIWKWIPLDKFSLPIKDVLWPMPFIFDKKVDSWYTLLNLQQGLLLPNTWNYDLTKTPFDGQFCTSSAYMPWYAQIKDGDGCLSICETPWDAAYTIDHNALQGYTHVGVRWMPSLQTMRYPRILRTRFYQNCDYNTITQDYRQYVEEKGIVVTLQEKAIRNPLVDKLIGASYLHKGIKTFVEPESNFYNKEHPEQNNSLVTFQQQCENLRQYKKQGATNLYLHLDGWGVQGYDNQHPDILPPNAEAGGWDGLKRLSDIMKEEQDMLALHDQYRDYYHKARSYHRDNSVKHSDGTYPSHAHWAGGPQDYLCPSLALSYVKRNFNELFAHQIHVEGSYLDVFTCNEPDECANPLHPLTRKEALECRNQCFAWLMAKGILPSSEEVNEWALPHLVTAHYAPYEFMMHSVSTPRHGIPIPLFNLVYHDCFLIPWPMDIQRDHDDYMLYAMLNGGGAYLDKDGAYPNTDGVFMDEYTPLSIKEKIERHRIVADLQKKVAKQKMIHHCFINNDALRQKSTFEDGTTVEINLHTNHVDVQYPTSK